MARTSALFRTAAAFSILWCAAPSPSPLAPVARAAAPGVRVWEGTLDLPTYEEGLPDVNPPFDVFETRRFNYPYTLRENLTDRARGHALARRSTSRTST